MISGGLVRRTLGLELPEGKSAFLWGARKTGKSTYLARHFAQSVRYDLLRTDLLIELTKRPAVLRERLLALAPAQLRHPIIIDEVQKVPMLLDEVHWLIENRDLSFILCGSSARKLRRGQANLLGGRAWRYQMFPLTTHELGDRFELLRALNHGLVPSHYLEQQYRPSLRAYVDDYLAEEIRAEGLTRNLPAFARFLDALSFQQGELVNFSNIARDCGVDSKTVREYFNILVDTLLGYFVLPWKRRTRSDSITAAPKFYLFDVGVSGQLMGRELKRSAGAEFGRALEHLVVMEVMAHRAYAGLDYSVCYWRSKGGQEIDLILGNADVAIEVKGSARVDTRDFNALRELAGDRKDCRAIVVANEPARRRVGRVTVLPWRDFFSDLWQGKIIR